MIYRSHRNNLLNSNTLNMVVFVLLEIHVANFMPFSVSEVTHVDFMRLYLRLLS